jgi:hypothetical protein
MISISENATRNLEHATKLTIIRSKSHAATCAASSANLFFLSSVVPPSFDKLFSVALGTHVSGMAAAAPAPARNLACMLEKGLNAEDKRATKGIGDVAWPLGVFLYCSLRSTGGKL